jgi:TetR/AcrR family transcriptional regulator
MREARQTQPSRRRPARRHRTETVRTAAAPLRPVRKYVPSEERRRQILEAAAELFAHRGFAGTTTREIAAIVGTTETVLFRHFPTKESLYAAILEHRVPEAGVQRWLSELNAIAARKDDEALFTAVVAAILESFRRDSVYHRLLLFASLEGHELARVGQSKYSGPFLAFLREYIVKRQAEGAFRRMRPEWAVHVLLSSVAYYAQWNALGSNPLGLTEREVASQAVNLMTGLNFRS